MRSPCQFDGSQCVYGAQSVFGTPVGVEGPNGSERLPVNLRGSSRSERPQSVWRLPLGLRVPSLSTGPQSFCGSPVNVQGPNGSECLPVHLRDPNRSERLPVDLGALSWCVEPQSVRATHGRSAGPSWSAGRQLVCRAPVGLNGSQYLYGTPVSMILMKGPSQFGG